MTKAPQAFWQSLGSISSPTVIEQVFASAHYNKILQREAEERPDPLFNRLVSWTPSFLQALKPGNRPVACKTLMDQLFQRIRNESINKQARLACFQYAVKGILKTLTSFSDNADNRRDVSRIVLTETLDIVSCYIETLLSPPELGASEEALESIRGEVLSIVRNALRA